MTSMLRCIDCDVIASVPIGTGETRIAIKEIMEEWNLWE